MAAADSVLSPESGSRRGQWATLRTLFPYLWPGPQVAQHREMRLRVAVSIACLVLAKAANVYLPIFYKYAVDALTGEGGGAGAPPTMVVLPLAMILAYGGARVLVMLFGEARDAIFAKVTARAIRAISVATLRHLHALSLRFHLDRQTGGLSRSIERGTNGIDFLLGFMLFNILPTLLEILLVCAVLWSLYSFWFAAVTFGTIAIYIGFTMLITEWRQKFRRQMNEMDTEANAKAIDSLLNYETVKYFGNEDHEARRFDGSMQAYELASVRSQATLGILNVGQASIIAIGVVAVMIMAANGVVGATMTVGDFVLVNTYLIQLYLPLNFLGFVYREIKRSLVDLEQMFALLGVNREVADRAGAAPLAVSQGAIEFDRVSFGYDPRRPILKDVSFRVPAGGTVAIVGPSGSGKSTVTRLLFRFYDIGSGTIRIDGQDVRDVTQASLRAAIGIVPQDTVMFNDTIYYNIAYGRPGASPAEIEGAARLARIHDFVMALPDRYESRVGERGLKLSGGEKQRVAIARTILKNPPILVFDEATSALDTQTEREIQASLDEVSAQRTTLVIAHRLSTVIGADEILVLDDGRIVERGTHAALLAQGGLFAAMWARQQAALAAESAAQAAQ